MNRIPPIPLDIPEKQKESFIQAYTSMLHPTGRLLLIACDHALEHCHPLNFTNIFNLANKEKIPLATHLETIARYANSSATNPFIVKLNGKTNLISTKDDDPQSDVLTTINDLVTFKKNTKINVSGVGYTLYPGSSHEHIMLQQAEQMIFQAHQHGLVTFLWLYPRGKAITDELDPQLIIKMAGMGNALGADCIKLKIPHYQTFDELKTYVHAIAEAAGNSTVLFSGGEMKSIDHFLNEIKTILSAHPTTGLALGRNIIQRPVHEAQEILHAIITILNN